MKYLITLTLVVFTFASLITEESNAQKVRGREQANPNMSNAEADGTVRAELSEEWINNRNQRIHDGDTTHYQLCEVKRRPDSVYICINASYSKLQEDQVSRDTLILRGPGCSKSVKANEVDKISKMESLCSRINSNTILVHKNVKHLKAGFNALRACSKLGCSSSSTNRSNRDRGRRGSNRAE